MLDRQAVYSELVSDKPEVLEHQDLRVQSVMQVRTDYQDTQEGMELMANQGVLDTLERKGHEVLMQVQITDMVDLELGEIGDIMVPQEQRVQLVKEDQVERLEQRDQLVMLDQEVTQELEATQELVEHPVTQDHHLDQLLLFRVQKERWEILDILDTMAHVVNQAEKFFKTILYQELQDPQDQQDQLELQEIKGLVAWQENQAILGTLVILV